MKRRLFSYWICILAAGCLALSGCKLLGVDSEDELDIPTSGLVAYYPFDGNAKDRSGNGLEGTVVGAMRATDRFGKSNAAYQFENGQYISFGDVFNDITPPFSISVWVKTHTYNNTANQYLFASDINPTGDRVDYYGFWLQPLEGDIWILYGDGGNPGYQWRRSKNARLTVATDTWVHLVAVVRSASDMSLYVDANLVEGNYSGEGGDIRHNASPAIAGKLFTGSLDDLAIYNQELSALEVQKLYQSGGWER